MLCIKWSVVILVGRIYCFMQLLMGDPVSLIKSWEEGTEIWGSRSFLGKILRTKLRIGNVRNLEWCWWWWIAWKKAGVVGNMWASGIEATIWWWKCDGQEQNLGVAIRFGSEWEVVVVRDDGAISVGMMGFCRKTVLCMKALFVVCGSCKLW